jgi:hypothetical protein
VGAIIPAYWQCQDGLGDFLGDDGFRDSECDLRDFRSVGVLIFDSRITKIEVPFWRAVR